MEWRSPAKACNIVRDWNKSQGMTHPSDEHIQIRRDINVRYVSIENSSNRPIGIAVTTFYESDQVPKLQIILEPGEIKNIGINSIGSPMQFLHILDPVTEKPVGNTTSFRTDCNSFVLRDGVNGWFTQFFKRVGFRGAS